MRKWVTTWGLTINCREDCRVEHDVVHWQTQEEGCRAGLNVIEPMLSGIFKDRLKD